jgi:hypothetical protein
MREGRREWIERLHAVGKRASGGRKPGVARPSEPLRKLAAKKAERRKLAAEANRNKASAREAGEVSPRARRRQIIREVMREAEREAESRKKRERESQEAALKTLAQYAPDLAIARGWIPPAPPIYRQREAGYLAAPSKARTPREKEFVLTEFGWRLRDSN